jgi:NAD(P)-dependent dehydrogenase (short-subunit alcohol dehydrogenase family)
MDNSLQNKVAVITGAASGIGLASLELLVEHGAKVVAADRDVNAGRLLEKRFGRAVHFQACDVTLLDQLHAAISSAAQHFGGLDILFNNAGSAGSMAGVEDFDPQGWDSTAHLLLRAVAAGTSYAVPFMKLRGGGSVISTSSISALQAGYAPIAYSVAKAGVLHYTKLAATELSANNIRINAIVPGFIATNIFGAGLPLTPDQASKFRETVEKNSGKVNPLQRAGMPQDIAKAVLFLASDASSFMTGSYITVDGGITIGPRHAWDLSVPTPMNETFNMSREQMMAMRASARGDQ